MQSAKPGISNTVSRKSKVVGVISYGMLRKRESPVQKLKVRFYQLKTFTRSVDKFQEIISHLKFETICDIFKVNWYKQVVPIPRSDIATRLLRLSCRQ